MHWKCWMKIIRKRSSFVIHKTQESGFDIVFSWLPRVYCVVTMTQWFSSRSRYMLADQYKEVKYNAIDCGPIHNERTNRQLLSVKWKGEIQSAKMKHLPDWFKRSTFDIPDASSNIRKRRKMWRESLKVQSTQLIVLSVTVARPLVLH